MSGSSAPLQAAELWEKTRGKGTRYMQGRLGGVKLVILPNRDYEGDPVNGHTHTLFFQDGSSPNRGRRQPRWLSNASDPPRLDRPNNRQQVKDDPVPIEEMPA